MVTINVDPDFAVLHVLLHVAERELRGARFQFRYGFSNALPVRTVFCGRFPTAIQNHFNFFSDLLAIADEGFLHAYKTIRIELMVGNELLGQGVVEKSIQRALVRRLVRIAIAV